ncbi:methylenetetrahydrofolate--tRNA-(uracil(54)-C(5))-methyltransferase (FADH(2)-oxidizing) TrmFO [Pararhodospirillum photometricum]|uniref:Methylenetetrahydrofolate--tRNA-(uracil-5-)-methyltransferase TrmFO n=1 Tax=Pararhodospirillum photometricum DSM 122 TaxID=1150469 RepID=H6SLW4_PARPM|nr:methylenetetrahydrofolate--tRNA-(uracil(54)-C(5))-methyltransferase (FADH(2)-oxidizing) TrmFO [Pararhodospirillum photometricum]CCG08979.1 Methylenetetrahydrofolate--tRNA-(uracil-5-)-methyltransferase trmFO [Pararhodospirillum photometricum DSM 122]
MSLTILGGGLAGCEAAWQAARAGLSVRLIEMRPQRTTPAHRTDALAELVCSNSLRADDPLFNAVGLLHEEMRRAGSLILHSADATRVPAGGALAVDREGFSAHIAKTLADHPGITIERREVTELPAPEAGPVIVATGPLTAEPLAQAIQAAAGTDSLAFFDAIAPIVHRDSIDFEKAWFQSRYDKGDGRDYINCGLDRDEYDRFVEALLAAVVTPPREWEGVPYFDGCLPIEVMAARGHETLAFGPMKPVGLRDPKAPERRLHAVVQLRQDNALGTLYNMVGFQTRLRHGDQVSILRLIPGLEQAEFARLGGMHRNTFLNSPRVLDRRLRLKSQPHLRFAGQITGCEGYVESAAVGLLAGRFAAAEILGLELPAPPPTTALGALLAHVTGDADAESYQPMNINFGLFPPLDPVVARPGAKPKIPKGRERKIGTARRALTDLTPWLLTASPWAETDRPRAEAPLPTARETL